MDRGWHPRSNVYRGDRLGVVEQRIVEGNARTNDATVATTSCSILLVAGIVIGPRIV